MKNTHYALILVAIFIAHHGAAQTKPSQHFWGGSTGYMFDLNLIPHHTQITGEAIAATPDWKIENSLPLSHEAAIRVARQQLKELVDDEAVWQVEEISLCRVTTDPNKWYYRMEFTKSIRGQFSPKRIPLLVDLAGHPGKVWADMSMIDIWTSMPYEDIVARIKLCGGIQKGDFWSFQGYDAIIALSTDDGKIGMTFWTLKDFESESTRAATGTRIISATFYTNEKKVSLRKVKQ